MPLPFSHIVYADKILQTKLKNRKINKQEYFIGSVFPDIHFLAKIDKKLTHSHIKNSQILLEKIKHEKNSFKLGILVHYYIDEKGGKYWFNFFNKNFDVYLKNLYPIESLHNKFLFDHFKKNKIIKKYFDKILIDEIKNYPLTKEQVRKWHQFIQKVLSEKINYQLICDTAKLFGKDKKTGDIIFKKSKELENNKKIIQKIKDFSKEL